MVPTPEVLGGHSFIKLRTGKAHTIAIDPKGMVYTWGDNKYG